MLPSSQVFYRKFWSFRIKTFCLGPLFEDHVNIGIYTLSKVIIFCWNSENLFYFVTVFLSVRCSLWLRYGIIIEDPTITLVNTVGIFLHFSYLSVYIYHSKSMVSYLPSGFQMQSWLSIKKLVPVYFKNNLNHIFIFICSWALSDSKFLQYYVCWSFYFTRTGKRTWILLNFILVWLQVLLL